jgi:hypothetical protein
MASTFKQVLNKVLERIGEDQIDAGTSTLVDNYHLLLGSIINDVKEQIEDAHNWRALRQFINVTVTTNSLSATITGANERSRVLRIQQADAGICPLVFDITDAASPVNLIEIDLSQLLYMDTMNPNQYNDPCYFAVDNSSGDVLDLYVWPRPTGERTIKVGLVVPQSELSSSSLSTEIKIPVRPLVVGATWYALEERGEELGVNGLFSEKRFLDAIDSAISRDSAESGDSYELVPV